MRRILDEIPLFQSIRALSRQAGEQRARGGERYTREPHTRERYTREPHTRAGEQYTNSSEQNARDANVKEPHAHATNNLSSERGAAALYLLIFIVGAASLAVPFSEALTSKIMAAHHFRPTSWPAWGAIQIMPKMYSFAHTCWIGTTPLFGESARSTAQSKAEERFERESFWVNHYPARRARFDGDRGALGAGSTRYVYVRSRYFGHVETTGFRVSVEPSALKLEPTTLTIERRDEAP